MPGNGPMDDQDLRPANIHCLFPARAESGAAARRELERLQWTLSGDELQVLSLVVSELIENSVQHAGAGPGGSIGVGVAVGATLVRGEVSDEGDGFEATPRTGDSPLDSQWGLHVVDALAARWDVVAEPQTVVTFELDRIPRLMAPFPERIPA